MEVGLGAVRARELAVGILDRNDGALGTDANSSGSRSTRRTRQDSATTLRSDNVSRLLLLKDRVWLHKRSRTIGRSHARLRHETTRRHRTKHRRSTTANGGRSNGLRVRYSRGRLRHHGRRGTVSMVGRVRVLCH
jgi:hypothetical protein